MITTIVRNNRNGIIVAALAMSTAIVITLAAADSRTINQQIRRSLPPEAIATARPNFDIATIAHRGASLAAPENTLAAFQLAIDSGYDYIELDVRLTRDGVPVIIHDRTLERTTGVAGYVHETDYADIRELDAGSWFAPEFADQRIPTLEEALQLMSGKACAQYDTKAVPTVVIADTFRRYGFTRECLLVTPGGLGSGEDDTTIRELLRVWPDAAITPVVRRPEDIPEVLKNYPQTRAVRVFPGYVSAEIVDTAHASGLRVVTTTLMQYDSPEYYREIMAAGVDFMMLDKIDSLRQTIAAAKSAAVSRE